MDGTTKRLFLYFFLLKRCKNCFPFNKKLHGKLLPVHLEFELTFSLFFFQNQQQFFRSCFQLNRCEIYSCCRCLYCCWTHSIKDNVFLQHRNFKGSRILRLIWILHINLFKSSDFLPAIFQNHWRIPQSSAVSIQIFEIFLFILLLIETLTFLGCKSRWQ